MVSQKGKPNQEEAGGADEDGDAGGGTGGQVGQGGQSVPCSMKSGSADAGVEMDGLNVIEAIAIIMTDIKIDGDELLLLFLWLGESMGVIELKSIGARKS